MNGKMCRVDHFSSKQLGQFNFFTLVYNWNISFVIINLYKTRHFHHINEYQLDIINCYFLLSYNGLQNCFPICRNTFHGFKDLDRNERSNVYNFSMLKKRSLKRKILYIQCSMFTNWSDTAENRSRVSGAENAKIA